MNNDAWGGFITGLIYGVLIGMMLTVFGLILEG